MVTLADITIVDNETASSIINLSVNDDSIGEEETTATSITVTATLGTAVTRDVDTTVKLGASLDGTATEGSSEDYSTSYGTLTVAERTITIPAGTRSASTATTFTITPHQDNDSEGTETIVVEGVACKTAADPCDDAFTVNDATISLVDDDLPVIGLGLAPTSAAESAPSTTVAVTATRDLARTTDEVTVTVTVGASGSTATRGAAEDYTGTQTVSITIPANTAEATENVSIAPRDDRLVEGAETVVIGGTATGFSVTPATFTITDNDNTSDTITLSLSTTSLGEAANPTEVTVTATVNDGAVASDTTVTLSLGGTAVSGTGKDYTFTPATLPDITISAGEVSGTAMVSIAPVDDDVDESDGTTERPHETVIFTPAASGFSNLNSATLTITDNDIASMTINLSAVPSSVREADGGTAATITVTATLAGDKTRSSDTTVALGSSLGGTAGSGDYMSSYASLSSKSITIPAGMSSADLSTFTITPVDDSLTEGGETITVTGSLSGFTVNAATINLVDNDTPSTSLTLSVDTDSGTMGDQDSLAEGDSAKSVTITATLDGGTRAQATTVTLSLSGDAVRGTDYTADAELGDTTLDLTIAAHTTSASASFDFTPTQDDIDEGTSETITVGASARSGAAGNTVISVNTAAIALPSPRLPPVTSAVRPSRFRSMALLPVSGVRVSPCARRCARARCRTPLPPGPRVRRGVRSAVR